MQSALPYYAGISGYKILFHIIYKRYDFRGEKLLKTKCMFLSLQPFVQTILILRTTQRDTVKHVHKSSYKAPVILVIF